MFFFITKFILIYYINFNLLLQFVTSGALEWCIKGFLPTQQKEALRKVLDVIRRLVTPTLSQQDLPFLQKDAHTALVLFERDFPLSMQVFKVLEIRFNLQFYQFVLCF